MASVSMKSADWKSILAYQNAYKHEGFPVMENPEMGKGGGYANTGEEMFAVYDFMISMVSSLTKIHHWTLSIYIAPFIFSIMSIMFFHKFYYVLSNSVNTANWSIVGMFIFIIVSFEQQGERLGVYFLTRIAEDKGFLWLVGTPLYGYLGILSIKKNQRYFNIFVALVGAFIGLVHPLSFFWLSPIFLFCIIPYSIIKTPKIKYAPLLSSFFGLVVGFTAAYYQYAFLEPELTANMYTVRDFLDSGNTRDFLIEKRNVIYVFSENSYTVHPRLISDRLSLLCLLCFLPMLLYYKKHKTPAGFYCIISTVVFLIVLFIPYTAKTLAIFIGADKLDRMLWNIPFPLIFGVGLTELLPKIQKKLNFLPTSKPVKTFLVFVVIFSSTAFFFTRKMYYRITQLELNKQLVGDNEVELYNYLEKLQLDRGTRVWAPGSVGEYLPGFVYGVYPFSFRGAFDKRLEIPKGMEYSGTNRPDYLFYNTLDNPGLADTRVNYHDLILLYRPDFVVIRKNTKGDLQFLNDLKYRETDFEHAVYRLFKLGIKG